MVAGLERGLTRTKAGVAGLLLSLLLSACSGDSGQEAASPAPPPASVAGEAALAPGLAAMSAERVLGHIATLASDEFEGRQPGTRGEELTLAYLAEQFRAMGLEPGNPDGSYLQKVPLVGITADPGMALVLRRGETVLTPRYGEDFIAWTKHITEAVSVDAEMVFVGYGVQAPEFDWDDFKDLDVRGKVIVVLINDPPVTDEDIFGGSAMTYYGRWTYKLEKAAELGAAGALIIHETGPAGYPWGVFGGTGARERLDLVTADGNRGRAALEGWISREQADAIFALAGQDLDSLKQAALRRDFTPVSLGVNAQVTINNTLRTFDSYNVVARLPGSDPDLRDEHVVIMAHWDHVGTSEEDGDVLIFNGAQDNASGTAAVLELGYAFARLPEPPARSLLFIAVTGEEEGLLGSQHYGENPLYPLAGTAAVINFDGTNVLGPTRDLAVIGYGNSTLDDVAAAVAADTGRTLKPDPRPEAGSFYRSDHFSLAKFGVPAFYPKPGTDYIGRPEGWGIEQQQRYVAEAYHQPTDVVRDDWDLSGMVEDLGFVMRMAYRVANDPQLPEWRPGTEFRATREASLRAARATSGGLERGLASLSAQRALAHIATLASDEFEGRKPGTRGEELTLKYIVEQFEAMGLEPGNPDGTFLQRVPLVGITADPSMQLLLSRDDTRLAPVYGDDFVAWTSRVTETVSVDAEMVFAGYGVQAPEFDWDDFKDLDVRDKVLVVLINDPQVADEDIFGGPAMTYYGRWTYKFEKAAELGAAGVLIIHETGPAGYPWEVVGGGGARERFDLVTDDRNMANAGFEGWLAYEQAEALFALAGQDLAALKEQALTRDFRPVPLGVNAQLTLNNTLRTVDSYNVVARLPGSDPVLRDEYVAYMAHWDHVGTREQDGETLIYNGAVDNASGTAGVLEVAYGFSSMPEPPVRSLLFIAVTAEEQGLLGSRHYGENPLYPLAKTLAVINLDGMNVLGPTSDLVIVGLGNSTLDDIAAAVAAETGRTLKPDPEPEKGYFYRSDHFSLAKFGVPALFPNAGIEYIGKPEGWGVRMRDRYTAEDYHKPSDTVRDDWNLEGLIEDARFFLRMGYRIANDPQRPEWRPGTEFRAIREASLREAGVAQ